jgi:hypothetical protein
MGAMKHYFLQGFGPNPSNSKYTLADLEKQLEALREYGAPDDAEVIRATPYSVSRFEIQWIGEGK